MARSENHPRNEDIESQNVSSDTRFNESFSKIEIRNAFIRKVYAILAVQFAFTTAIVIIFKYNEKFFLGSVLPFILIGSAVLSFITIFLLSCIKACRRTVPWNFILLSLFTIAISNMVGIACLHYEIDAILYAAGLTFAITLSISLFSSCTKFDFTKCIWIMFMVLFVFVMAGFAMIIIRQQIMQILYAAIGVVIFTIYLAIDTQLILGGRRYEISPEEYILAAINLYMDIISIFLRLLQILSRAN